jgi:hypothetical protein
MGGGVGVVRVPSASGVLRRFTPKIGVIELVILAGGFMRNRRVRGAFFVGWE